MEYEKSKRDGICFLGFGKTAFSLSLFQESVSWNNSKIWSLFFAGKRPQLGRKVSPIVLMMLPYMGVMDPHICGVNREIVGPR